MSEFLPDHKLVSAEEMHGVIKRIMAKRDKEASQSQYDVMVCVRSVAAAREVFEDVPVKGSVLAYGDAVIRALDGLQENYNDPEGEYTSKGMIGDVNSDIYQLVKLQTSPDVIDVDRKEAREVLVEEIRTLAELIPQPPAGLGDAVIKAEASGASGHQYFVDMTIQEKSDGRFTISGNVYNNDSYQYPLFEEPQIFDVRKAP